MDSASDVPRAFEDCNDDDGVRRGVARCKACRWIAIMRGDTDAEIAEFLRRQYVDHLRTMHRH
jgi:hypothetical protein